MVNKVNKELLHLISMNECNVKDESDLVKLSHSMWIGAMLRGAYGLYSSHIDNKSIFLFYACSEDDIDYVLAHEFGHFISNTLNFGIHKKPPGTPYVKEVHEPLVYEEEFRADTFSALLLPELGLKAPAWMHALRMSQYETLISEERRAELTLEVNMMLIKCSAL